MMANLGCQLGYIRNQLNPKQLFMSVRGFLDQSLEEKKLTLNPGHTSGGSLPKRM